MCLYQSLPQREASGGRIKTFSTRMYQRKLQERKQNTIKMIIETKGEQRFKNRAEQLTDRSIAFIWHLVLAIASFSKGHLDEIRKEALVQRSQQVLAKRNFQALGVNCLI